MAATKNKARHDKHDAASSVRTELGDQDLRAGAMIANDEIEVDMREYRLFASLDVEQRGYIVRADLDSALLSVGLRRDDFRLRETFAGLDRHPRHGRVSYEEFCTIIRPNILLVEQALQGKMVIPEFDVFCAEVTTIFEQTEHNRGGEVARYIPQLARVNPEQFAVAICTVDGQRFSIGDSKVDFCIQSCCKPINYTLALEEHGEETAHLHVGREPSGRSFNEMVLNSACRPHNPLINAGAIMATSLIKGDHDPADRFDHIMLAWTALAGGEKPRFNNAVYLSERATADRNFALAYMMSEKKAFPKGTDLVTTLELYFQCCSIEMNAEMMSIVAATLANGGVCPASGERVLKTRTVQNCLSLMYSCGMYDFSGEFAFTIGLPAKSGVGGGLMIVVPNVMGVCTWSPRLDAMGNSVRGVEFCKRLVQTFNFHNYDNLTGLTDKKDPRVSRIQAESERVNGVMWAATKGDLGAIQRLVVEGIDINVADYDGRTPLHLAAAEGRSAVVRYFIAQGANLNPRDRWGGGPLDDAYQNHHEDIIELLERHGATRHRRVECGGAWLDGDGHNGTSGETEGIIELIWAASKGALTAMQRLVARGVRLVGSDYDGRTPLHLAAAEGHVEVVQYLISHKVDINPRDRWGSTPLEDALRHRHEQVVSLLKKHGAVQ